MKKVVWELFSPGFSEDWHIQEYIDCEKIEYLILSIMGTFDEKYQFITTKLSETLERVDTKKKEIQKILYILTFKKKTYFLCVVSGNLRYSWNIFSKQ